LIHRSIPRQLDTALACYLGAAILFLIANVFPIVTLEAEGHSIEATLAGTSAALYAEQKVVGLLVMLTTLLIPAVDLFAAISLLWLAKSGHSSATLRLFIRLRERLRPWNMTEIFTLGVLVATVKLGNLASVIIGPGIWCLGTFMLLTASASHAYDSIEVWNEIETPP
jgi:paraquat-inducible protein A